jgi:hypothetical protein
MMKAKRQKVNAAESRNRQSPRPMLGTPEALIFRDRYAPF